MALLFMDGFDAGINASRWSVAGGWESASTRFGVGKSITLTTSQDLIKRIPASSKVIVGFALNPSGLSGNTSSRMLSLWGDEGGTEHLFLHMPSPGQLVLRRGLYNGTILGTATIATTGWQYIELSGTINDTTGTATVRVNGQTVIDFTGDTKNGGTNTTIDQLWFEGATAPPYWYFDDIYICDGTGTTNNDFLGDVRVQTLLPTGAGSSTQLTPTGGANYANVAENPDSTATYNSSATVGERDTYAMADVSASTGLIYGVQNSIVAWKSDAGAGSIKTALKAGSTVYYDTTISLGTSAAQYSAVRETNPDTSTAWTVSDINAVELGAEVA